MGHHQLEQLGEDVISSYEALNGVPSCLIENAIHNDNEEDARQMATAFVGHCHGYANNKQMPSAQSKSYSLEL